MKKIFTLFLLFISVSFAQTARDIRLYRGDSKALIFKTTSDYSSDSISFVVKASRSFSSPRLIWKTTDSLSQVSVDDDTILVYVGYQDSWDLASGRYVYDLTVGSLTLYYGNFYIDADVQSPVDGVNLPSDGTRITTVALDNGTINHELVFWDTTQTKWIPSGVTVSSGGSIGNADSLGGLPASSYPTNTTLTDSLSKYADKTLSNLGTTSINANLTPNLAGLYSIGEFAYNWNSFWSKNYILKTEYQPYYITLTGIATSSNKQIEFPNKSGTIALLDDIGTGGSGGLFALDGNGDLMPSNTATTDTYYELDGNGDIQPL